MTPSLIATLGTLAVPSNLRNLVLGGQLLAPATLTRAQASTRATVQGVAGTWSEMLADTPRTHGAAGRLLVEGQRTNAVRNPRAQGATLGVIGAGGVVPTNWASASIPGGITVELLAVTTTAGVEVLRLRIAGTATAAGNLSLLFETTTGVPAAQGQTWTCSAFIAAQVNAGAAPPTRLRVTSNNAGGSQLAAYGVADEAVIATLGRFARSYTLAEATTAFVRPFLTFVIQNGQTYDTTYEIGWPQIEQAGFASTPILPAVGSPAASVRGADLVEAGFAAMGLAGPCTVLWSGMLPQVAPSGLDQTLVTLSDGTDANRIRLRNTSGGASIVGGRVAGGSAADAAAAGSLTPGTAFRAGLTHDGAGRAAFSVHGGAAQAITGAPTTFTRLHLGNNAGGTAPMFGETRLLRVLPQGLSDAALAAAVGALP